MLISQEFIVCKFILSTLRIKVSSISKKRGEEKVVKKSESNGEKITNATKSSG